MEIICTVVNQGPVVERDMQDGSKFASRTLTLKSGSDVIACDAVQETARNMSALTLGKALYSAQLVLKVRNYKDSNGQDRVVQQVMLTKITEILTL